MHNISCKVCHFELQITNKKCFSSSMSSIFCDDKSQHTTNKNEKKKLTKRVGQSITNLWYNKSFKRFEIKTFPPMYVFLRERKSCS